MRKSLLLLTLAWCPPAMAEDGPEHHPFLTNGLFLDVGVFFARRDLEIAVSGSTSAINTTINVEQSFGTDDRDEAVAAELGWRYGQNWSLSGQFFKISTGSSATLDSEIEFGDEVFPVGAAVNFGSGITVTRVFAGRHFDVAGDRGEFGLGAGFHWLSVFSNLEGNARVGDSEATEFVLETARAEGPLPNLGAWYIYSLTPKLAFRFRVDWMEASVGVYDGRLINIGTGLNYAFTRRFGAGLNYNYLSIKAGIDDDWRGTLDTQYDGVFLNLTGYF